MLGMSRVPDHRCSLRPRCVEAAQVDPQKHTDACGYICLDVSALEGNVMRRKLLIIFIILTAAGTVLDYNTHHYIIHQARDRNLYSLSLLYSELQQNQINGSCLC